MIRGKLFKPYRPTFTSPCKVAQLGVVEKMSLWKVEMYWNNIIKIFVVYSFGVDGDPSFEADNLPRAQFWKYDLDFSRLGGAQSETFVLSPGNKRKASPLTSDLRGGLVEFSEKEIWNLNHGVMFILSSFSILIIDSSLKLSLLSNHQSIGSTPICTFG